MDSFLIRRLGRSGGVTAIVMSDGSTGSRVELSLRTSHAEIALTLTTEVVHAKSDLSDLRFSVENATHLLVLFAEGLQLSHQLLASRQVGNVLRALSDKPIRLPLHFGWLRSRSFFSASPLHSRGSRYALESLVRRASRHPTTASAPR